MFVCSGLGIDRNDLGFRLQAVMTTLRPRPYHYEQLITYKEKQETTTDFIVITESILELTFHPANLFCSLSEVSFCNFCCASLLIMFLKDSFVVRIRKSSLSLVS